MQDINDLRQRVAAATERYGKIDANRRTQSERLVTLIKEVEAGLERSHAEVAEKQTEIDGLKAEVETLRKAGDEACAALDVAREELSARDAETARLGEENAELRAMIANLLQPFEGDEHDGLDHAMAHLNDQVDALTGAPATQTMDVEAEELPDEIAAEPSLDDGSAGEAAVAEAAGPETSAADIAFTDIEEEIIAAEAAREAEAEATAAIETEAEDTPEIAAEIAAEETPAPEIAAASAAPAAAADLPESPLDPSSDAKSGANRPSTVRKIIERVSALAEELEQTRTAAPPPAPAPAPPKRAAAG